MQFYRPAFAALLCLLPLLTTRASADIVYSTPGPLPNENFIALGMSGGNLAVKLPGWLSTLSTYNANTGDLPAGGLYNFAPSGTNRSLGSIADGSTGTIQYGVRLTNATGLTLGSFTVNYTGKQWRDSTSTPQSLTVDFVVGESPTLASGGYTAIPGLTFISPVTAGSAGSLNGNLIENLVNLTATVTGVNWLPGQELLIRWTDIDDIGDDHALAIDNFGFSAVASAVPEASAFLFGGLIAGVFGLGYVGRRVFAAPA